MPAIVRLLTAAGALLLAAGAAHAQVPRSYPTHPVRVVVGFTAGGPTDVIARLVAQKLSDGLGQNFYVENVAGRRRVAAAQVARAPADGYTLHVVSTGFIVNPSLYAKGADATGEGLHAGIAAGCVARRDLGQSRGSRQDRAGADRARERPIRANTTSHSPAPARRPISTVNCSSSRSGSIWSRCRSTARRNC